MSTATQNLENDHKIILHLTDVMETMIDKGATNKGHFTLVISLIQNYADGFHHTKEENIFFPFLFKKGFSKEQGPVSVMLDEHAQGREFLKGIVDSLELYKAGNIDALNEIYFNMNEYVELLRAHIGKENHMLFRMADRALSEMEQNKLLDEFTKVETNNYAPGQIQEYINEIKELENTYK